MAIEVASRLVTSGPLLSRAAPSILARRSLPLAQAATLPILKIQQRKLHLTPRSKAPISGRLGTSNSSVPTSYFQRPSLPANTVVKFVPQQTAWVVERMGRFNRILTPGLAILWPFLDRIAYVKSLKEAAIEIPSQSAITADNVTLDLDGVLYTRVFDAYKASYGVEDAEYAISQLAQTTMRSEIGQLTLDHVLRERAALNTNITTAINEAAKEWGIVCLRYEIRDIHAPDGVVAAMHRQVTAERSKRAEILDSEGQRQSAINIAEGRKQSVILASEALKSEQINMASGEAEAILLKAKATAAGIDAVAKSIAEGKEAAQGAVSLSVAEKYVDAFAKLAKEGTAVVVPGNVGDIGSMIASAMAVYGKVGDAQAKTIAAKALENKNAQPDDGASFLADAESPNDEMKRSMLASFENTRQRK
ncbi:SPFH domain/Band 7 family protein [Diplocarpon rosae]|nr:SPFH domain/Band 7 family protein [Diplocarpon rosae]